MDEPKDRITRRGFVKSVAAAAVGARVKTPASSAEAADTRAPDAKRRPNVLVVFTDQQRWDTVGAYGSPMGLTPNLDAMAKRGVRFEHAFTCQPVCSPARGSLQTGKYATAHGVWRNGIVLPPENKTLAHCFKERGYRVGYIGKWHLAGTRTKPVPLERRGGYVDFWEASDVLEFTSHPYDTTMFDADNRPIKLGGYRVDALTGEAIKFLRSAGDRPFFLFLSYVEPHHQNDMGRYVAPNGYAEKFANPYVPPDLKARPGDWFEHLPSYYGIIARIDECLGKLLSELERLNLAENTVVLFTTDHGCHFRTRNSEYKRSCHEASIRIPAVIQGPGFNGGKVVRELVSLVDFPPTLLDAAGVPVPEAMQGRSVVPLVRGEKVDWPDEVFVQLSEVQVGRAIRTERWKYCVYAPDKRGSRDSSSDVYVEHHIYDLFADPYEQVNLIGRRDYRKIADELRERLIQRMVAAGEKRAKITAARYYE